MRIYEGKTMIDQKNTIIGVVLAVVLVFILGMVIPFVGGIIALIIAGIVVGYLVNNSLKTGAMHGTLVGFLTGVIYIFVAYAYSGFSREIVGGLIIIYLVLIPVYILLGFGGGIIGAVIKARQKKEPLPDEVSKTENSKKDEEEKDEN